MSNNGGPTRCDLILYALKLEIERRRGIINGDCSLSKLVVTIHLTAGGGHPRSILCHLDHETPFKCDEKFLTAAKNSLTYRTEST